MFLFIAWYGLPLTLREPFHLQDVLPTGQRQVVCRVAAGEWGTKLLLMQGGFVLEGKGPSHWTLSLVTLGRKCPLRLPGKQHLATTSLFKQGRACRAGKGNILLGQPISQC